MQVQVRSKSGVRRFQARLEQSGRSFLVLEQHRTAKRWKFWRPRQREELYQFLAGRKSAPQLQDGPARLILEAESDDFRGATATLAMDLSVRTTPPQLSVEPGQHYINQGGSEMAVFHVGPEVVEAGVRTGPHEFRSWPLPGATPGTRFAFFAYSYDLPPRLTPLGFARDEAGNEATATFWFRVFPKEFRSRDLDLTKDFLEKVTQDIYSHTPQLARSGDLLADFLKINGALRREDNRRLADLRFDTEEKFLWREPFRQLADSQVEAHFADHRRYFYQGKKVDEQDHLGFDLAVTANVPVLAANDGRVVFAGYLGIYGNCVVIDHGYGLQSIYGHLSSVAVKAGDRVQQGREMGRSGSTGLAGGDHLHFSMQVDGVTVNPTEWWDQHWIRDRILARFPEEKLPGS
ncbi:MAG: M23 family metallopeptidase [Acidobacteria bacterium]|nr:M23 family metallopeptidase [Acidobacteriota bacterium]